MCAALSEREKPVFLWLSSRRDSRTAKLVLYNSKGYIYVTDKESWYVKAVKELGVGWIHETFGDRYVVERFFRHIKHKDAELLQAFSSQC